MTALLHIDASVRHDHSLSRSMSRRFIEAWMHQKPGDEIIRRDIGREPPPFVNERWIAAAFTPLEARDALMMQELISSDTYIAELRRADVVVLGTPMYNYGMPAPLKAWIDQVVRINETFSFDLARGDWPLRPTTEGKTLILLTACGEFGFDRNGPRAGMNHLDTHLAACSAYLGISRTEHIAIEYQEFKDDRHTRSVADAERAIDALATRLSTPGSKERSAP